MEKLTIAIYAGNFLNQEDTEFMSILELQKFIAEDAENGGHYLPLSEIETVLEILVLAKFIDKVGDLYTYKHKNINHVTIVKNVVPLAEREEGFLNLEL